MDVMTLGAWLQSFGWDFEPLDENTLRIYRPAQTSGRFYLRCTENWVLLAIVPVLEPSSPRPADLSRRLLAVNRDMRLAKFAFDQDGDVALTAELPTEELTRAELQDAVERMRRYVQHYKDYLSNLAPG